MMSPPEIISMKPPCNESTRSKTKLVFCYDCVKRDWNPVSKKALFSNPVSYYIDICKVLKNEVALI